MELTNGNNIKINRNVIFYPIIEFSIILAAEARKRSACKSLLLYIVEGI